MTFFGLEMEVSDQAIALGTPSAALCAAFVCYSFVASTLSGNYSSVDRLWSIVPVLYSWTYLGTAYWTFGNSVWDNLEGAPRALLLTLLVTLWGARLTWNFWRKGGYSGDGEDYRWPILQRDYITHPVAWVLFNLLFISLFQHVLLFALTVPVLIVLTLGPGTWALTDLICSIVFILLLTGETIADNQQWKFQTKKYALLEKQFGSIDRVPMPHRLGFLTSGLFSISRHPNFFCEVGLWWTVFGFSILHPDVSLGLDKLHVAGGIGATLLTLLFQGSTNFTESISLSKYPAYSVYQSTTSRLIPWFPGRKLTASDAKRSVE